MTSVPSVDRPPVADNYDAAARNIAADASRLPFVYRYLLVHLVLSSIEREHRTMITGLVEFSGLALPMIQGPTTPAIQQQQNSGPDNPLFDATQAAGQHSLSGAPKTF